MSIKEIEFKLYTKGISSKLIEKFVSNNIDVLEEYENKSLKKIIEKKHTLVNEEQLMGYLLRRGFKQENILKLLYK
jgi:SOS response regulatory protein OraA/RecX